MEAGGYNVRLTTLYDSNQKQSYIRDEVARRHTLRYIRVPERTVKLSPATKEKATKLYILDVRPRSRAMKEPEVVTCYGVEGGQRTLPEEFGANELRHKFAKRPGRLTNSNVAQPEADMELLVGADNPYLMPTVIYQSVTHGTDLFVTRNPLYIGEMLAGETSGTAWTKKGAAGGGKEKTSAPKQRQQQASKRPVKAPPVQTPAAASEWQEGSEEQPAAGPSGVRSGRRLDSSPALSMAASDTMVSAEERAASSPPARDSSRGRSSSEEPRLPTARKSRARLESSASEISAASPERVAHGDGSSRSRAATLELRAKSSDSSSGSEAGFRGRSRDSSASSSRAVDTRSGARDSSAGSSRAVDTGAGAGDSSADEEDDSGAEEKLQKLTAVQKVAADSLIGLVQAREQLKKAAEDVQQEVARQLVSEKKREELKKMAEARVKKQAAKKQAAEAAAAKEEEAKKKLEADRLRVEQEEQREEERKREQREEERKREQEEEGRREQEEEKGRREREDKKKRREQEDEKKGREQKETKRRLEESRETKRRLEESREARKRSEDREARKRSEDREARKRSEDREARRRSEDFRRTEGRPEAGRAEAGRAEDEKKEAGLGGRCVRDRRMQERLGRRSEERPGPSSGPEGAGLEPGYSIPRRSHPQKTTASPSRSLPSSYRDYAIALPRGEEERQVFQQLLDKKMLFRDPGTGPEGYKQPCFRFRAGEPIWGGEGADRRRSRSPERQETARKRHRNHKD
jgi:hypothetical protein